MMFCSRRSVLTGGPKATASAAHKQEVFDAVNEALKTVSNLVRGGFAGSKASMTVADLALMATYSSLRACKLVDHKSFWYVEAWFKRCRNQVRREMGNQGLAKSALTVACLSSKY